MFPQNQAPWAQQPGPGNHIQQGPRPGSGPQPWGQQQQMPQSGVQSNQQFPGLGNSGPGQQPWGGNQQMGNSTQSDQSLGQPWMSQNQGGPGPQQPQNFPPYYSQNQQQPQQQQRQIPQQSPQPGQHPFPPQQPAQQQFPGQQQNMPSNDAPWGQPQQNQPWQQQVSPQQQQMPPQQQRQGMQGPKSWMGTVTELIPPNYGIVDGEAFFVNQVVIGKPPQVGERVNCEAIVNTGGGNYKFRCTRVQVAQSTPMPMQPPAHVNGPGFMGPAARPMLPNDYKLAPPPTNSYQTDLALAAAANSMGRMPMQPSVVPPRRVFPSALKMDEEARRRSEAATQQLMQNYSGQPNVGIRLMSKMGYGVAGAGLGAKGQGIAAPVQPVSLDGSSGLGFQLPPPMPERRPFLRRRSPPPPRRVRSPNARRGRSKSPSRIRQKSSLSRSKSRSRSRSPRSQPRHGGRYKCEPPKYPPYTRYRTIPDLSKRYADLYIPPEFCRAGAGWLDSIPDHKPLSLLQPVDFQVKKEEGPDVVQEAVEAVMPSAGSNLSEADKLSGSWWTAKVVLMTGVSSKVLHAQEPNQYQQPSKRLQFVVGRKGKHELMAIGGRWDSCDGDHPERSPQALLKTAVRTFKEASSVDLSSCKTWDHFAEFSYLRAADKKLNIPEHIEKTVLFLVDPSPVTTADPEGQNQDGKAEAAKAAEEEAAAAVKAAWRTAKDAKEAARELEAADKARQEAKTAAAAKAADNEAKTEGQDSKLTKSNSIPKQSPKAGDAPKAGTNKGTQEDAGKGNAADDDDCTPRDSDGNELAVDIDANKLTAAQLQEELTKRGLDVKWQPLKGKKVLVERLQEWIAAHKGKKQAYDADMERKQGIRDAVAPAAAAYEEAKKVLKKASTERRSAVQAAQDPPPPVSLALWPNKDFLDKRTKFGIDVLPLEALLDYNEDDVKECHFEVSMFAEMFREMLQTRFGRGLVRGMAIIEQEVEKEREVKEQEKEKEKEREQEKEGEAEAQKQQQDSNIAGGSAEGDIAKIEGHVGNDEEAKGNTQGTNGEQGTAAEVVGKALEPVANGKDTEMIDVSSEDLVAQGEEHSAKGNAKGKEPESIGEEQSAKGNAKGQQLEPAGGKKAKGKQVTAALPKEAPRRSMRSSKTAKDKDQEQEQTEVSEDSLRKSAPAQGKDEQQTAIEANTAPAASDTLTGNAEEAVRGSQPKNESAVLGTKRPADALASADGHAVSLLLPPNAKRQKTDADWGKSSEGPSGDPFLLACRFFDRECAGYLDADDLEEIAFMVSDGISRRRVQTLVDNVTKHGKLRYQEHSQLQIPQALPPVAEALSTNVDGMLAKQSSGPAVSDKEWKTLLGKLASSEKVRRAAEASVASHEQEAEQAAMCYESLQEQEQVAQAQIRVLKEQLTGMRASRFKANDLLSKGLESAQPLIAQLTLVKEQIESAQGALRKVDTRKLADSPDKA